MMKIKKHLRVLLALSAAIACALCSSCGVVSINRPYEETEAVTQPEAETEAIPQFDVYKSNFDGDIENFLKRIAGTDYAGSTVKIVTAKKSLVILTTLLLAIILF